MRRYFAGGSTGSAHPPAFAKLMRAGKLHLSLIVLFTANRPPAILTVARRNDETYMNALGADRIPDPTTAGDFLRRFDEDWIFGLQETFNETRRKVWNLPDASFRKEAIIDVDGTVAETTGQCKQEMDIAYNGIWGYAPLIVTLANTNEALYPVNRPGNRPSSDGAAVWIDHAIDLVALVFRKVWLRGDTDFSLTGNFDRWDEKVRFIFGYDAKRNLIDMADALPESRRNGPRATRSRRRSDAGRRM